MSETSTAGLAQDGVANQPALGLAGADYAPAADWIALLKPRVMTLVVFTGWIGLVIAPGPDFKGMVRDVSRPAENDGLPPAAVPSPAMIEALARACERRGISLLGPPMAG